MLGCKVFLTYKRRRLTGNRHAPGNGCHNSVSVPKVTLGRSPDLYDGLIDKHTSEDQKENSVVRSLKLFFFYNNYEIHGHHL